MHLCGLLSYFALSWPLISSQALASAASSSVAVSTVLNAPGNWGAPCLIQVLGDGFYSFATNNQYAHVPVAYSADFEEWDLVTMGDGEPLDAMPYLPTWVDQENPSIWAPDVNLLDNGTYIMYFVGALSSTQHCLGYAYADTIKGPYIPYNETWFCPDSPQQAIDPDGFKDPVTGKRYVTFKWNKADQKLSESTAASLSSGSGSSDNSDDGEGCNNQGPPWAPTPITLQEVDQDGVTKIGDMSTLIDNDGRSDSGNTESPSLMRTAAGAYVLFFSTGCFYASTYTVSYAVSTGDVTGPYVRHKQPLFETGDFDMFGPGTADVLNDGLYMVLFAQNPGQTPAGRKMRTALVDVEGDVVFANGTLPDIGGRNGTRGGGGGGGSNRPDAGNDAASSRGMVGVSAGTVMGAVLAMACISMT